jgi:hypothetical protein
MSPSAMPGRRRMAPAGLVALVLAGLAVVALVLASLGGSGDETRRSVGEGAQAPTTATPPDDYGQSNDQRNGGVVREGEVAPPNWAGLGAYRQRCRHLDLHGAKARVLYEAREELTRGDSGTIVAAVTLDGSIPREKVLHRNDDITAEEPGLVVSCRVEARLNASHYQFDVSETGWVARSLLSTNVARWSWYVTPKLGGTHTLVLDLRPILTMSNAETHEVSAETANVQQFETRVHVSVPWIERPQETMARLANTLKVAEGLVKAMTLLTLALVALGAALGIRRKKTRRATA